MTTALSASQAYATAARALEPSASEIPAQPSTTTPDFSQLLGSAIEQSETSARTSHAAVSAVADGQTNANLVEVVTAVAETEVALQTMVSVRDRVISAYQEIMRMPI